MADSATPHPDPSGGQCPRATFAVRFALTSILSQGERKWPPSATPPPLWIPAFAENDDLGGRIDEGMPRMANERLPEGSIPDRSPGHAFVAIADAGWCRHTKV